MPELLEVGELAVLGRFHLVRRIAARTTTTGNVVLHLGVGGQREEALEGVVGAADQFARNAVAADAAETVFTIGVAQFGNEGGTVGVVTTDVEGRNFLHDL